MNYETWKNRIAERNDLTSSLIHLTKASGSQNCFDVILQILDNRTLKGSTTESGFIVGNRPAVCLQDTPIYSLAQNVYYEQKLRKKIEMRN